VSVVTPDSALCTQDLFTGDGDCDLYLVSRSDEIIKTRGEKVGSIQVENVVREEGSDVEPSEVVQAWREQLEKFAVLGEVRFIKELPETPSGKVRRRVC
jgi:long-chain acyl-CoA synthetase